MCRIPITFGQDSRNYATFQIRRVSAIVRVQCDVAKAPPLIFFCQERKDAIARLFRGILALAKAHARFTRAKLTVVGIAAVFGYVKTASAGQIVCIEFAFQKHKHYGFTLPTQFAISLTKRKKIPFTALSYFWGEGKPDYFLQIGGNELNATEKVASILRRIREQSRSLTLWIDQICINEKDPEDKAALVILMRAIYARAAGTIIWLGDELGAEAFEVLEGMANASAYRDDVIEDELDHLRNPPDGSPNSMNSLRTIFLQEWSQRTWIIQEAILSKNAFVISGGDVAPWDEFARYCSEIAGKPVIENPQNKSHRSGLAIAGELYDAWLSRNDLSGFNKLFDWLVKTRYTGVTSPKDKVYGLLGICSAKIEPNYDYAYTHNTLYYELAVKIIQEAMDEKSRRKTADIGQSWHGHSISKILSCTDHDPENKLLPSWAPDWSKPRLTSSLGYGAASVALFQAGSGSAGAVFEFLEDIQCLKAVGICMGSLEFVSDMFENAELTYQSSSLKNANASLRSSIEFVNSRTLEDQAFGAHFFSTFCIIVVAGSEVSGRFQPLEEYIEILSILCDATSGFRTYTFKLN